MSEQEQHLKFTTKTANNVKQLPVVNIKCLHMLCESNTVNNDFWGVLTIEDRERFCEIKWHKNASKMFLRWNFPDMFLKNYKRCVLCFKRKLMDLLSGNH